MQNNIPLYKIQNSIDDTMLGAIAEVLKSGWLTLGPKTIEFERVFSSYVKAKYAIATNSCTSSLYMALDGVRLSKGALVVVPVNTFVATANAVRFYGAEPIFCDVGEDGEIDPVKLETLLEANDNVSCVIPVHLYGYPCDMGKICKISENYQLKLIEDCAQAHGAEYEGKAVGTFGDAGCFSFYATKNITTGEGGILVTNSEEVRDRSFLMRNHGQNKTPKEKVSQWRFDVVDLGFNFRMSEISAAIGLKQMEKINTITISRREIAKKYKEELDKINGIKMLHDPLVESSKKGVYHLLEILIERSYPLSRDELYDFLKDRGITTGVHYSPLHYFTYYQQTTNYQVGDFPCAEELYSKILSLPIYPFMSDEEFQTIINALKEGAHC